MIVSIVAFVVLGSVLEGIPAIVLFGPLLFPIARQIGIHEVHYAMVVILAMGIGLFAPPFGVGYYAACAIGRVNPDDGIEADLALSVRAADRACSSSPRFRGYRSDSFDRVLRATVLATQVYGHFICSTAANMMPCGCVSPDALLLVALASAMRLSELQVGLGPARSPFFIAERACSAARRRRRPSPRA